MEINVDISESYIRRTPRLNLDHDLIEHALKRAATPR